MEGGASHGSGDVSRSLSSESGDRFSDLQILGLGLCYKCTHACIVRERRVAGHEVGVWL